MRVLDVLVRMFCLQFGCEPEDVVLAATLDDLNIAPHERKHMVLVLEEMYGIAIDDETLDGFETVEDVVGHIEDNLTEDG